MAAAVRGSRFLPGIGPASLITMMEMLAKLLERFKFIAYVGMALIVTPGATGMGNWDGQLGWEGVVMASTMMDSGLPLPGAAH